MHNRTSLSLTLASSYIELRFDRERTARCIIARIYHLPPPPPPPPPPPQPQAAAGVMELKHILIALAGWIRRGVIARDANESEWGDRLNAT